MNLFSFIKANINILDVVSDYATLKRAGHYWKGSCPFHHEKTASFTVSPEKEIFYCFGCHIGGDVISFVAKAENCSPKEAAYQIAERYQLTIPEEITNAKQETSASFEEQNRYFTICKHVAYWCHQHLKRTPSLLNYLEQRGLHERSIKEFSLGYFPGGYQSIKQLLAYMQKNKFIADDLLKAGIVAEGKKILYSGFENRLIFPIKDHLGRFCGFGGRIVQPNDQRPKYYNSRENTFFNKGSLLFGLDRAKKSIQETEKVFLVEGYTDCIALVEHGFANTVATLGTACTVEHLRHLSRHAQELYVLYDSDNAGQKAIMRLAELCWQVNLDLKVVSLPKGEDPASYLQAGNDLTPRVEEAATIFDFFINTLSDSFAQKSLHEKVALTKRCIETIGKIEEPLKQDILLQKAAQSFEVPFQSLKNELERLKRPKPQATERHEDKKQADKQAPAARTNPEQKVDILEKKIFCAILNNVQLVNKQNELYLLEYLPSPFNTILERLRQTRDEQGELDFVRFFDNLEEENRVYVSKLLLEADYKPDPALFETLLLQLHKKRWKQVVHDIKTKLMHARAQGNNEQAEKILEHFQMLKKKMIVKTVDNEGDH